MDGILNICKPTGISSFKALAIVKRRLGLKKVGHLGTLDPNACGVLVFLCGRATKLNETLSHSAHTVENGQLVMGKGTPSKIYRSVFTFGIETDTLDPVGQVIKTSQIIPNEDAIKAAIVTLTGEVEIEIPHFSAVHINGQRAYDLARAGIAFTAPRKTVNVKRFELLNKIADDKYFFEIECETGTYIRSLAKTLAENLGTVAIASTIIRTRVGGFDILDAKPMERVTLGDLIVVDMPR
jgi:tRNA pseudouridine55 synthase